MVLSLSSSRVIGPSLAEQWDSTWISYGLAFSLDLWHSPMDCLLPIDSLVSDEQYTRQHLTPFLWAY